MVCDIVQHHYSKFGPGVNKQNENLLHCWYIENGESDLGPSAASNCFKVHLQVHWWQLHIPMMEAAKADFCCTMSRPGGLTQRAI